MRPTYAYSGNRGNASGYSLNYYNKNYQNYYIASDGIEDEIIEEVSDETPSESSEETKA